MTTEEMLAVLEDRIPYADPEVDVIVAKLRAAEELVAELNKHTEFVWANVRDKVETYEKAGGDND